ncbi:Uncharacterised protein [Shigella sonnei]|nr:Uncharacterised protein [Shigella sonnei]CSE42984.1 Uncharacterised protein [Shigella sonnei]CSF03055.1 Uncharacterised protein [Shigella sonnei]CSF05714.1 Uncharacterised protein [Shigella sonnei]CSP56126.1 Uncharacterised protein [Shigella sonnei]
MSITLTVENSHRTFFVIAIRIAGAEWRNSRKRITGIQVDLHRRRGGSFRCHQGIRDRNIGRIRPLLNSRRRTGCRVTRQL